MTTAGACYTGDQRRSSTANGSSKGAEVGAGDPSGPGRCDQTPSPSQIPCALPAPTGPRPGPGRPGPSRLSALAGGSPSCRVCPSGSRAVLVRTGPRTAPLFRRESIHRRVLRPPCLTQSFVFGPQWPSQPPCEAPGGLTAFPPGFCSQAGCLSVEPYHVCLTAFPQQALRGHRHRRVSNVACCGVDKPRWSLSLGG